MCEIRPWRDLKNLFGLSRYLPQTLGRRSFSIRKNYFLPHILFWVYLSRVFSSFEFINLKLENHWDWENQTLDNFSVKLLILKKREGEKEIKWYSIYQAKDFNSIHERSGLAGKIILTLLIPVSRWKFIH